MGIVGLGADLIEVARVAEVMDRHGVHFLERCFTQGERAYCDQALGRGERSRRYAARFAAKEAAAKALRTGIAGEVGWQLIEVIRGPEGPPSLVLHGGALEAAARLGASRYHLTLSHERTHALAVVVFEG